MNATRRDGLNPSKILQLVSAVSLVAMGCSGEATENQEWIDVESSALNGTLIPTGGPLTRLTQNFTNPSENARENETVAYYNQVRTGVHGVEGGTIASTLSNFTAFKNFYGFGSNDIVTYYYNRGDLGIGREMHCVDKVNISGNGQIACYVKNFAAGDDGSEFTFGLSSAVAFTNLHANNAFATVAMVYRDLAGIGSKDRVFFAVYDGKGSENLLNAAALDRHGITFANAFKLTKPANPDPSLGTPGVNFNNHIPSNCVSCHGGQQYDPATHSQTGALFLPFDLDQFAYEDVAGRRRADQENAFKHQNEIVRKVAVLSQGIGDSIKNQLDKWYANTSFQTPKTEVFENSYDSNAVPTGWVGFESIYRSVIRRSCRTCHISNEFGLTLNLESSFRAFASANVTVTSICNVGMPHSLQAVREFWQSNGPTDLASYLTSVGLTSQAAQLRACSPGTIVTLDPPPLSAALSAMAL